MRRRPSSSRDSLFLLNREDDVLERLVRAAGGDERSVRLIDATPSALPFETST